LTSDAPATSWGIARWERSHSGTTSRKAHSRTGSRKISSVITSIETPVVALLAQAPDAQCVLIIIDQFEELFTQIPRPEQAAFIAAITALRQVPSCVLMPTMRADFYEDLMNSDLWPIDASQRL
jgi:hypothetical protein